MRSSVDLDTKCRWGVRLAFKRDPENDIYLISLDGIDMHIVKGKQLEVITELIGSGVLVYGMNSSSLALISVSSKTWPCSRSMTSR